MPIKCIFGAHEAVPSTLWNDGYFFSRCSGCGCEMVRKRNHWHTVPKSMRVVWKPKNESDIDWGRLATRAVWQPGNSSEAEQGKGRELTALPPPPRIGMGLRLIH